MCGCQESKGEKLGLYNNLVIPITPEAAETALYLLKVLSEQDLTH